MLRSVKIKLEKVETYGLTDKKQHHIQHDVNLTSKY